MGKKKIMWVFVKLLLSASVLFTWFQTVRIPLMYSQAPTTTYFWSPNDDDDEDLYEDIYDTDDKNRCEYEQRYNECSGTISDKTAMIRMLGLTQVEQTPLNMPSSLSLIRYFGGTHAHEWFATGLYAVCVLGVLCAV